MRAPRQEQGVFAHVGATLHCSIYFFPRHPIAMIGSGVIVLLLLILGRIIHPRLLASRLGRPAGFPGRLRGFLGRCRLPGGGSSVGGYGGSFGLSHCLRQKPANIFRFHRTKSGHAAGGIEVPRILRQADKISDRGIARPGAAKRRTRHIRRHASGEKSADVGSSANRFNRRQARRVEERLSFVRRERGGRSFTRGIADCFPGIRLAACLRGGAAFAAGPSREKTFVIAHRRSRSAGRASASRLARARLRFSKTSST